MLWLYSFALLLVVGGGRKPAKARTCSGELSLEALQAGKVLRFLQGLAEARMECFRGPNVDMLRSARPSRGPLVELEELAWPHLTAEDVLIGVELISA